MNVNRGRGFLKYLEVERKERKTLLIENTNKTTIKTKEEGNYILF